MGWLCSLDGKTGYVTIFYLGNIVESGTLRIEKEMGGYINWILDVGCKWD
jgi:hypothetical protein